MDVFFETRCRSCVRHTDQFTAVTGNYRIIIHDETVDIKDLIQSSRKSPYYSLQMHTINYVWSRGKDNRHSIRSAVFKDPIKHINIIAFMIVPLCVNFFWLLCCKNWPATVAIFAGMCTHSLKSHPLRGKWNTLRYVSTKSCRAKRILVPLCARGNGVQIFTEKLNQKFLEFEGSCPSTPEHIEI